MFSRYRPLCALLILAILPACTTAPVSETPVPLVKRYPIPNSDFPISQAVEVPAGKAVVFHSGLTPSPAKPDAVKFSAEYWGTTEQQTVSVLGKIKDSLVAKGMSMGDVVKMQAFLVGDPATEGRMDFDGYMLGYRKFFGTAEQPNLPARTTVQIAALGAPGMLVEIEVFAVRP